MPAGELSRCHQDGPRPPRGEDAPQDRLRISHMWETMGLWDPPPVPPSFAFRPVPAPGGEINDWDQGGQDPLRKGVCVCIVLALWAT